MTEDTASKKPSGEDAVKLREAVKSRKPKFRTHESWRYKRVKESWRKPRGLDNRMRLQKKGWPKSVNTGYGGPRIARGLHPSGYEEVIVHNSDETVNVDPEKQAIRIAHSVGTRKRIQITSLAKERRIHVLNPLVRKVEEERVSEEETAEEEVAEESTFEPEKLEEKTKPKRTGRRKRRKEVKEDES